jgi:DNA primase
MAEEELRNQLEALRQENARLAALQVQQYPTASVNRVAVKLPPFWAERPSLWFSQVDSQFAISGITSEETKFNYVVAQLDTRYAAEVEDIITTPPPTERYKHLRTKLVERLSISEEQRVRQLINEEELGDRKPSQFLRHLRSLAGTTTLQDNILRQLWLRRLPSHAQAILTAQSELPLEKVAELADKIVEVQPAPPRPSYMLLPRRTPKRNLMFLLPSKRSRNK